MSVLTGPWLDYDKRTRTLKFNPLGCLVWVLVWVLLVGAVIRAIAWAVGA